MTAPRSSRREHLLLYEPRTEGHHLGWLRFITEDLLAARFPLSLAVDLRAEAKGNIEEQLAGLLNEVKLVSACDRGDGRNVGAVAHCLRESGAGRVFLCSLDEIASQCWRRAALGFLPPADLRGRMGGIYHRPSLLSPACWSPNRWLKLTGFRRLLNSGWLRPLFFLDEYLVRDCQARFPGAPIFPLPNPCPDGYDGPHDEARRQLGVPLGRRVFLFYGGGYRRKGLHLAAQAMLELDPAAPAFLLCAGQQNPEGRTARDLEQLVRGGRAQLINRYVSVAEEKLAFAACDVVLLPYLNHFGTSDVLARAMAAGKMVIVSDEQLLGHLTRECGVGLLFPSGDVAALRARMHEAANFSDEQFAVFTTAARRYAQRYSRAAFRQVLLKSLGAEPQGPPHA